ncbi:MAG: alpha/beta fold hydrolase [Planctomycetota bacterium]|nr:alpha/beta fold hydrolase [Planctomycetota bacterium]
MSEVPQWRSLYPFESHEIRVQGMRYHYLDEGEGPTLLLVHGNPTWSFHWRNIVLGLRGRCRLVVPDHIGCGLSDKPQQYDYTLAQHIENLSALVEQLDLRDVTLVAQDWGGAIGLGAMLQAKDRFSRAVLMNTGAFTSPHMPWRIAACRIPGVGPLAVRGLNGFAHAALTMAVEKRERITPDLRAGILAPYDSWANRVAINRFVQDIPMHPGHPSYARLLQIEHGLPSLADRQMMLIWGMKDWCFTPWFLERFEQFFPAASVYRFADCGHWVVEDAHERIVPLIDSFVHGSN